MVKLASRHDASNVFKPVTRRNFKRLLKNFISNRRYGLNRHSMYGLCESAAAGTEWDVVHDPPSTA